jgi:hypothetical protein
MRFVRWAFLGVISLGVSVSCVGLREHTEICAGNGPKKNQLDSA